MAAEGYKVSPPPRVRRHDIIQVSVLYGLLLEVILS